MKLLTAFPVVALLAALCSAQPVVTSEPEPPNTLPAITNSGQSECPESHTKVEGFCIPNEVYGEMKEDYDDLKPEQPHTSGVLRLKRQAPAIMNGGRSECPKGYTKVNGFCIRNGVYNEDYDDLKPKHTTDVLRLKRQAPTIIDGSGECPKGHIKVNKYCIPYEVYKETKGEYDDSERNKT